MPDLKRDIAFLALARNCQGTIPNFLSFMDALSLRHGLSCRAFVGENGSTDGTRTLLSQNSAKIELIDTSFMARIPHRLKRMAIGRQAVADYFRQKDSVSGSVVVIDLDDPMLCPPDAETFVASVRQATAGDVFAVASTSRPYYYDLLAYEDESQSFAGIDRKIASLQKSRNPITYYSLFRDHIYPAQRRLTSNVAVECISAFNGLCIYDAKAFVLGSYIDDADFNLCEHVNFNRRIHEKTRKKMVIDPELRVAMPSEHGPMTGMRFAIERTKKLISRATR